MPEATAGAVEVRTAADWARAAGDQLVQLKNTSPDGARWPVRLHGRLPYLQEAVETADFPPTDQQVEVARMLSDRTDELEERLAAVLAEEVARFDQLLRARTGPPTLHGGRSR